LLSARFVEPGLFSSHRGLSEPESYRSLRARRTRSVRDTEHVFVESVDLLATG
jgi:hypothetical protein